MERYKEVFSDQSCGDVLFEDEVTAGLVVGDESFNSNQRILS